MMLFFNSSYVSVIARVATFSAPRDQRFGQNRDYERDQIHRGGPFDVRARLSS
jgi:hypothetical protein